MGTHTPGPWIVEPHSDEDEALYVCAGLTVRDGITRAMWIAECELQEGDLQQNAANARLISTAPEGLALARAIVDYFGDEPIHPALETDIKLREMARAIIAKAAGAV